MNWRLIRYQVGNPAWNMALDEALFQSYLQGSSLPTLRFYGWDPPTVSLGYFQNAEREIELANIHTRGFGLVRRNTGGRAVLHDRELTYSVIAGAKAGLPDSLTESYLYISRALVAAFRNFGIQAELHQGASIKNSSGGACFDAPSWYELTVEQRKLVGSAQLRQKDGFLQHGSILLEFIVADLTAVIKAGNLSEVEFRSILEERVTSFKNLGVKVSIAELEAAIIAGFNNLYQIDFITASPSQAELEMAEQLVRAKYANPDWNLYRGKSENQRRLQA